MTRLTQHPPIPMLDLSREIDTLWDDLNTAIQRVLRSGQFVMGPEVEAFEREVAAYLGVEHAVGVNSGTDALVIGLRALGIGEGDEVITTPFSFFATAESISNVGATPVFADVDPHTFNLEPEWVLESITPRTRAILPVHLFGLPAAMDELMSIAREHNLLVIEDCAQAFGARYHSENGSSHNGKRVGSIGDVGAFSFYPTKNLGAYGDGGLITTDHDDVADLARMLRNHGSKGRYHHEMLGYNSRLDALQAAILRVKLPHVDAWNEQRRRAAGIYNELLCGVRGVITPKITAGHVFHQYTVRLEAERDEVRRRLEAEGIGTAVYYPRSQEQIPIHISDSISNPTSRLLVQQVLSLPIWPDITSELQRRVSEHLRVACS